MAPTHRILFSSWLVIWYLCSLAYDWNNVRVHTYFFFFWGIGLLWIIPLMEYYWTGLALGENALPAWFIFTTIMWLFFSR